jgi:putative two-component system response regulator
MSQSEHTILVVDDVAENIELLCQVLAPKYKVRIAKNGEKALQIIFSEQPPDLVLLDVIMPGMSGYDVCKAVKAHPVYHGIPIIFVTSLDEIEDEEYGLGLGAADYIVKPISAAIVQARLKTHLALYDKSRHLEHLVSERTMELELTRSEIVMRLGRAAEFRDNETGKHVIRMSHFSRLIGEASGMPANDVQMLFHAAPMHDVGKIGIPDRVLGKPGKLEADEWAIMMDHAKIGAEILGGNEGELLDLARLIAITHHEKWDGSGYPKGLKGEQIPLVGRIVAIADVFDALTSERPYKKAWTVEKAVETIQRDSGTHFDPNLVPIFISILPEILKIKERYAEESLDVDRGVALPGKKELPSL